MTFVPSPMKWRELRRPALQRVVASLCCYRSGVLLCGPFCSCPTLPGCDDMLSFAVQFEFTWVMLGWKRRAHIYTSSAHIYTSRMIRFEPRARSRTSSSIIHGIFAASLLRTYFEVVPPLLCTQVSSSFRVSTCVLQSAAVQSWFAPATIQHAFALSSSLVYTSQEPYLSGHGSHISSSPLEWHLAPFYL